MSDRVDAAKLVALCCCYWPDWVTRKKRPACLNGLQVDFRGSPEAASAAAWGCRLRWPARAAAGCAMSFCRLPLSCLSRPRQRRCHPRPPSWPSVVSSWRSQPPPGPPAGLSSPIPSVSSSYTPSGCTPSRCVSRPPPGLCRPPSPPPPPQPPPPPPLPQPPSPHLVPPPPPRDLPPPLAPLLPPVAGLPPMLLASANRALEPNN
ncbi:hypothetical protein I4F81_007900 [Pyropia yezoensis]|uniref:Uncharacterized protein n=1 Tax=Pyropia yezoensis TaxID=2788 RepID=A0ACC3C6H9_PYRYE|nr:hypothetical protein I4F81_007900 [Neopyropia yezoensis]